MGVREVIPANMVRDHALRKERIDRPKEDKDRGNKNDEHTPEGTNATPGSSEWTENLFVGGDWRVSANAWAGFGLRMLLIFGTLFSVYQYMAARHELRVERALQMVELWERNEYQAAQEAVKDRLFALNEKNQALLGKNPTRAELEFYYKQIGIAAMSSDGGTMPLAEFQKHFDRVVYFLNRIAHCVDGNVCAKDVADDYFHDYAASFWSYFSGYVEQQRKAGDVNFARPIEEYIKAGEAAQAE